MPDEEGLAEFIADDEEWRSLPTSLALVFDSDGEIAAGTPNGRPCPRNTIGSGMPYWEPLNWLWAALPWSGKGRYLALPVGR